jgi:hypothetical protein
MIHPINRSKPGILHLYCPVVDRFEFALLIRIEEAEKKNHEAEKHLLDEAESHRMDEQKLLVEDDRLKRKSEERKRKCINVFLINVLVPTSATKLESIIPDIITSHDESPFSNSPEDSILS